MGRDSNVHGVGIIAPEATVLQTVAQSMSAGQWVQLTGGNLPANINTMLSTTGQGHIFAWGSKTRWNPTNNCIEWNGGGAHSECPVYGRYVESTNSFERWNQENNQGFGGDYNLGNHQFDHFTVNPYTGKIWQRVYGNSGSVFTFTSGAKTGWSDYRTGNPITTMPVDTNIMAPMDWWSEPSTLTGAGAQGLLVAVSNAGSLYVQGYNPLTNTWPFQTVAPNSTGHNYNMVCTYSKTKNVLVFGGGNSNPLGLYKLASNGVATKFSGSGSPPFDVNIASTVWIDDPTTGNFLITNGVSSSEGRYWQFNPDGAGTWTQLPNLPSGMHWNRGVGDTLDTACAAAIYGAAYNGVVAYLCSGANYGRMWLYKHA